MNRFHNQGRGDWKYQTATITAGINFISLNLRPVCVYSLTGRKHFKAKKPQKHICMGFKISKCPSLNAFDELSMQCEPELQNMRLYSLTVLSHS